jgi:hypothetical protein
MSDIYKVSDGTRVVVKGLRGILIPCFWDRVCMRMGKYTLALARLISGN